MWVYFRVRRLINRVKEFINGGTDWCLAKCKTFRSHLPTSESLVWACRASQAFKVSRPQTQNPKATDPQNSEPLPKPNLEPCSLCWLLPLWALHWPYTLTKLLVLDSAPRPLLQGSRVVASRRRSTLNKDTTGYNYTCPTCNHTYSYP